MEKILYERQNALAIMIVVQCIIIVSMLIGAVVYLKAENKLIDELRRTYEVSSHDV